MAKVGKFSEIQIESVRILRENTLLTHLGLNQ